MSNIVKAPFAMAATLAGALALSGCGESPYDSPKTPEPPKPETGFSVELIRKGNFLHELKKSGAYRMDIPAEPFGGKSGTRVPCLLIVDTPGVNKMGAAASCDWSKLQPAP
ncbi:MAG TPA: hypothetical protein PKX87_03215 [Alphaproteobacteria bacterium]|nr:hypothetical protein [Alphaproteobacteria bacterium]